MNLANLCDYPSNVQRAQKLKFAPLLLFAPAQPLVKDAYEHAESDRDEVFLPGRIRQHADFARQRRAGTAIRR